MQQKYRHGNNEVNHAKLPQGVAGDYVGSVFQYQSSLNLLPIGGSLCNRQE